MAKFYVTQKKSVFIVLLTFYLIGCSQQISKPEATLDCLYPNQKIAPAWVCGNPFPGIVVQAVGVADESVAGLTYMYEKASLDALKQLREVFQNKVSNVVIHYLALIKVLRADALKASTSVVNAISSDTLAGAKQYQSEIGPNGSAYVLLGFDESIYRKMLEEVVKTSMENDHAFWVNLQTGQSLDELANAISRYPLSE